MDGETELQRIQENFSITAMPSNPWNFEVDLGDQPQESICRLLAAMAAIARYSVEDWPSDEQWEKVLPAWLLAAIPRMSKSDADNLLATTPRNQWASLPWDRLSWIDALRDRGWRWWGWGQVAGKTSVVVHIAMYPERIDAFRELLRAADIRILSENPSE